MTNWEKIKQMSAEEFAYHGDEYTWRSCEMIMSGRTASKCKKTDCGPFIIPCLQCRLKWLESEAEK